MFNYNRKRDIKNRYYDLFLYYQKIGDWEKASIYGDRYLNFGKRKNKYANN